MPTGTPKAGFRRSKNYWSKVVETQSAQGIEQDLQKDAPRILEELRKLTKPIECPSCGTHIHVIDKDVAMYLVDHAIGRAKSRTEIDITESIQFSADQIDTILERILASPKAIEYFRIHQQALLGEVIEGGVIE